MPDRPPPPRPVARRLRREAGFGCCVCGRPFFVYHHIVQWAEEHHYRPQDMMVLCRNHADEADQGAMSESVQRQAKARPYNRLRGYADGLLTVHQRDPVMMAGSVTFGGEGARLTAGDEPLISLHRERTAILLSLTLYDRDDSLIALVDRNEWITGDPRVFDVEARYQHLVVRAREREITLDIDARKPPIQVRGHIWRHGAHVTLGASDLRIDTPGISNLVLSKGTFVGSRGIRVNSSGRGVTIG